MVKGFKKVIPVFILVYILISVPYYVHADIEIPSSIRIGLYFRYPAHNINTAVTSFNVCAEDGLQLGYAEKDKFIKLYEIKGSDVVTIAKDSVNGRNDSFHIQIGGSFKNLKSAEREIDEIHDEGIEAFLVFEGKWRIWAGSYQNEEDAEKELSKKIKKRLGKGDYEIIEPNRNRIAVRSKDGETLFMFGSNEGAFQIYPDKDNKPEIFKINGTSYRGGLEVRRLESSDMTVINILPLEEYLYGVIPCEIEANSNPEALKAQAVAARTYTLNNMGKYQSLYFNLCNTNYSQVYKGYAAENKSTNNAVDDTEGEVITYKGKLAQAYYFSSSGGWTEDSENVWGYEYPYLKSVRDKYESGKSNNYSWEVTYTAEDIKRMMLERSYNLGDIVSVEITKVSDAGRPIELVVQGTKDRAVFKNSQCRSAFNSLYSQWYTIETGNTAYMAGADSRPRNLQLSNKKVVSSRGMKELEATKRGLTILGANNKSKSLDFKPSAYTFKGKGWGHAVGMSQEGAKGMANAGFDYEEIIEHYFQGTKVKRL
ncbi:MAG: SpoIID/LytB domain-containing protein [Acetivibrionales bacterium]|jgi:stage II sporulation protein D